MPRGRPPGHRPAKRRAPPMDAAAARRMYFEGMSGAAIATKLGTSEAAVKTKAYRDNWVRKTEGMTRADATGEDAAAASAIMAASAEARRAQAWRRRMVGLHMKQADALELLQTPAQIHDVLGPDRNVVEAGLESYGRVVKQHIEQGYKLFGFDKTSGAPSQNVTVNVGLLSTLTSLRPGNGALNAKAVEDVRALEVKNE